MAAIIQRLRNFIYVVLDAPSQVSIEFIPDASVFWGIWVLYPYTDSFSSDYYGTALSVVMPEYAWGLLAIICGLGQIVFLTRRCKTATVIHRKVFLPTVHAMGNSGDELYSVHSGTAIPGLRNDGGSSWILYDKG